MPITFRQLRIFMLGLCSLIVRADVPATETLIIPKSKLQALTKEFVAIANIPFDQLRSSSAFQFSGIRNGSSFSSDTPQETLYFNLNTSYIPITRQDGFPFEFSYTPKTAGTARVLISGRLVSADPSQDPYLPQPTSGKPRKQFHEITSPYLISSNWQSAEYVVLQFIFNLKH